MKVQPSFKTVCSTTFPGSWLSQKLAMCIEYCVYMVYLVCEAAWVAVVLVPLLARKCRGIKTSSQRVLHQKWCSGVYRQNHSCDRTNFQRTQTTWEEKEAQDHPEHLAVDEPYQCSEAHIAPAEVEDSDVFQVCRCLLCRLFASVSQSKIF